MQIRSFRDHRTIYEAHDLHTPAALELAQLDCVFLETEITGRLGLEEGCNVEAVELPAVSGSPREIMLAVTTGGARTNKRTFESDKRVGTIQYRPASELILVYKPELGRIEVCGRDWTDRTAVASLLASAVLGEVLSERPLTQRNFDLQPFAATLAPEIPDQLADIITEFRITEVRFALGDYSRKVTITALPGEPIAEIAREVLCGVGTGHGRPFLCDVEIFLRAIVPDEGEQTIRFSITNRNRSTLQADPDPRKRAIGFDLLQALGVMKTPSIPSDAEVTELFPSLLRLLAHRKDQISALELMGIGVSASRLTNRSFLPAGVSLPRC